MSRNKNKKNQYDNLPLVFFRLALGAIIFYSAVVILLSVIYFPKTADEPLNRGSFPIPDIAKNFYENSYKPGAKAVYVETARQAAELSGVERMIRDFVEKFDLHDKRVLEVGAGSGSLQDFVNDYTGLDIAASAGQFFHKPFIQASATNMPLKDNEFDAIWSIWVLEHVQKPEHALQEMRRVVKNGGLMLLAPAWNVPSWATKECAYGSYSDLSFYGKLSKASLPLRALSKIASLYPIRVVRLVTFRLRRQPAVLRYTKLDPVYDRYLGPDSDAVNSIDWYETYLWFVSRGDECLNCNSAGHGAFRLNQWPLIIRVHKPS